MTAIAIQRGGHPSATFTRDVPLGKDSNATLANRLHGALAAVVP